MPRFTHAILALSVRAWIVHCETISRTSLAVRWEFAKVGKRAQDSASAARSTWWVYWEVLHHTKFMSFGSSQLALSVRHVLIEEITSMLMTTVSAPSTNSSGTTSK